MFSLRKSLLLVIALDCVWHLFYTVSASLQIIGFGSDSIAAFIAVVGILSIMAQVSFDLYSASFKLI